MQLKSIEISNVLSFPYQENRNDYFKFDFQRETDSIVPGNLSIIIGPNGAGKTNFLEVLTQTITKLIFLPYIIAPVPYGKLRADKESLADNQKK